ncbi:hypothetical protein [Tunturiibacter gelidoferens]|jgi:hypothetical protein|uniref:Uncharacterized protein n=1 Tax=Tunturiibacter gelidiferens TaxID=3069689 RepID=A0A9X0QK13_9BACT|nr:hypothetical protein [Edaphobacter lichenicola]MBB5331729.1 hypothetical protein [Edaphobacter lichenicola]
METQPDVLRIERDELTLLELLPREHADRTERGASYAMWKAEEGKSLNPCARQAKLRAEWQALIDRGVGYNANGAPLSAEATLYDAANKTDAQKIRECLIAHSLNCPQCAVFPMPVPETADERRKSY